MDPPIFRLIIDGPGHPAFNLAVDEVLFRGCLAGGKPFLRFYRWTPPGLSLGRFQRDLGGIDLDFCRREGIPVVRRPTGGRAVLHQHEITYSIGARHGSSFGDGGIMGTYHRIAEGLAVGLSLLGLEVAMAGRGRGIHPRSPNCFAASSGFELTWGGRKLVGSAQVREREGFLQHGSILLEVENNTWRGVFGAGEDMAGSAVGLKEAIGRDVDFESLIHAVREGFSRTVGISFTVDECTGDELEEARNLSRFRDVQA